MTTIKNKQTLKPVLVSIEQEADNCFCFHQIRQGNETKKGSAVKKGALNNASYLVTLCALLFKKTKSCWVPNTEIMGLPLASLRGIKYPYQPSQFVCIKSIHSKIKRMFLELQFYQKCMHNKAIKPALRKHTVTQSPCCVKRPQVNIAQNQHQRKKNESKATNLRKGLVQGFMAFKLEAMVIIEDSLFKFLTYECKYHDAPRQEKI